MELLKIKDILTEVSVATSNLLNVDIEIIDNTLCRVVGTGRLKDLEGAKVERKGMLADFFINNSRGKRLIVENPGFEPFCQNCPYFKKCIYKKAVYSSIVYNGVTLGVMGIVTFEENENNFMQYNSSDLLQFIDKMCTLITDKFQNERQKEIKGSIHTIVNTLDRGIIILDDQLHIKFHNEFIKNMLHLKTGSEINEKNIHELFPTMDLYDSYGVFRKFNYKNYKFLYRVHKESDSENITETTLDIILDSTSKRQGSNFSTIEDIIGEDKEFVKFKEKVLHFSHSDSSIMLVGDTGTGKELFARAIHKHSNRSDKPFVVINCSSIPESLIESELFGYEKGSFTGADVKGKKGKILKGHEGTIFLDEVEAIPLYIQSKLLRVLENRTIERIGSVDEINVDIRVIAATNVRLEEMVEKKEFREDLFHRLNVITLFVPPLIERKDDILLLARYFINQYNNKFGKNIIGLDHEVTNIFYNYSWRGNIRELKNAIEYAVNIEKSEWITLNSLPYQIVNSKNTYCSIEPLEVIEWIHIKKALDVYGWSDEGKIRAADALKISRSTIYRKINKYNKLYNKKRTFVSS